MIAAEPRTLPLWKKAWLILTPAQRRSSVGLLVLLLVGMFLEMLSLGMVVPALAFIASDDTSTLPARMTWLSRLLGNPSRDQLVGGGVTVLLGIAAIKAAFLAYLAWRQTRLSAWIHASLGQRLFATYLTQPWTFHLRRNSAELVRNAALETGYFAQVISSFLLICTDVLVMLGITILLLVIQPLGTVLSAAVLGVSTLMFQRLTQPAIGRWGSARQHHDARKLQHIQQGLGGAKDVKVLGREARFIDQFQSHNAASAHVLQRQGFVASLPRLWYELIAIAGLCLLTLVMVLMHTSSRAFVPTLGLFAASAFKLLPSINRLIMNTQTIRFSAPVINTIHAELQLPMSPIPAEPVVPLAFADGLELERVSFRYPGATADAIHDVSLRIPKGAAVGFIGESGAGKSTLVDILLGLLEPTSGAVKVDGVSIASDARRWQRIVGYVPQSIYLSDDTLRRNIAFGVPDGEIDDRAIERSVRAAQLDDFVAGLPKGIETSVGERGVRLSGGQRQRIGIARALYHNPAVLVLDEATSALDTETERGVMDAVNALHGDKTLIIVAHRLTTVADCDVVYRFQKGRLVASGTYSEVMSGVTG